MMSPVMCIVEHLVSAVKPCFFHIITLVLNRAHVGRVHKRSKLSFNIVQDGSKDGECVEPLCFARDETG